MITFLFIARVSLTLHDENSGPLGSLLVCPRLFRFLVLARVPPPARILGGKPLGCNVQLPHTRLRLAVFVPPTPLGNSRRPGECGGSTAPC